MLVAAAFAPHPPLIVPEVAAGAAGDLDDLRAACDEVVARLVATGPDRVVIIGVGPSRARWDDSDAGTLAGFCVPLTVPLRAGVGAPDRPSPAAVRAGPAAAAPVPARAAGASVPAWPDGRGWMPLSVTIGAWLLGRVGYAGPRHAVTVPATVADRELVGLAAALAEVGRLALLVMGDGSARRSVAAPGYLDPRAAGYDAGVATALRDADAARLRSLDPALGAELLVAGVAPWRLAGHVAGAAGPLAGDVRYDAAPYGVGYLVAAWGPT